MAPAFWKSHLRGLMGTSAGVARCLRRETAHHPLVPFAGRIVGEAKPLRRLLLAEPLKSDGHDQRTIAAQGTLDAFA